MRTTPPTKLRAACVFATLLAACSAGAGKQGGVANAERVGQFLEKPDGSGAFFVDPHRGGRASALFCIETLWGRLVDVYDVDEHGRRGARPILRDVVVREDVQSDGVDYSLEVNPATQAARLVVLRPSRIPAAGEAPETRAPDFVALLEAAQRDLAPIVPKPDDGTGTAPFSFVPRNACVVLRFSDCLRDDAGAAHELRETVKLFEGYRPSRPFAARILFDPNHGGVVDGAFHSTRVLVDLTVSEAEALAGAGVVNPSGLPASLPAREDPNVSIRLPTRVVEAAGQFALLRGLSGATLSEKGNGPVAASPAAALFGVASEERQVVRAFRAGNGGDLNSGFLLDLEPPEVIGSWSLAVANVRPDPDGELGFGFLVDVRFASVCADVLSAGDTLAVGGTFLEVVEDTRAPESGAVVDVRVRALSAAPLSVSSLFGNGVRFAPFDAASPVPVGCWVSFSPLPDVVPTRGVSTTARVAVRFSEPMDSRSASPFDTFYLVRGESRGTLPRSNNIVVGSIAASRDARSFAYTPLLPLQHTAGLAEFYHLRIEGLTDLAGNALRDALPPIDFELNASAPTESNASVVLRFSSLDEIAPVDPIVGVSDDIRGQVFFDNERGVIRPRAVSFASYGANASHPVPSVMIPFRLGVQTPLTPFGSRLMTLWRYCDFGWNPADESKFDLDVYGLSWAPVGGGVLNDYFERFEVLLSHSRFLPDEALNPVTPFVMHPTSGLRGAPTPFAENIIADDASPQTVVHERSLGYRIRPTDVFLGEGGIPLVPYPVNRTPGVPWTTFTWRDTASSIVDGRGGAGVPLDIESGPPVGVLPANGLGSMWPPGGVPSVGLPLLMEFRCYPSDTGIGLNPLDVSLALNSSAHPSFRVFSSGGVNANGQIVRRNPDAELVPRGGFNPRSKPNAGVATTLTDDNTFYIGQIDVVTRVSRAHTVWIDTERSAPVYRTPVLSPSNDEQPGSSRVVLDFRGASALPGRAATAGVDARTLNAYGNAIDTRETPPRELSLPYVPSGAEWRSAIAEIDSARYFQMRLTFLNDIDEGLEAELSSLGIAFSDP